MNTLQMDDFQCQRSEQSQGCTSSAQSLCELQQPGKNCETVTIVDRLEWNAREPKAVELMDTPVDIVFIHHTAMAECDTKDKCVKEMKNIQNFHMDTRGWDDIGYNFLIGGDGLVYTGRGWDRVGAHTLGWNDVAVAFAVLGDFSHKLPSNAALNTLTSALECGVKNGKLAQNYKLYGHCDVRRTDCPGETLYQLIHTWRHYDRNTPVRPKKKITPAL